MIRIRIPHYYKHAGIYTLAETFTYHSKRYNHSVTCQHGMTSDGATGALDIISAGWWVHDHLCNTGKWDDDASVTNWQASMVLADILHSEGRYIRSKYWFWATFLMGGGQARKNGMFRLNEN